MQWHPDHSRVCGEKGADRNAYLFTQGSPPRVRGKGRAEGISSPVRQDHPRVCGEKGCKAGALYLPVGSPPRMRGKADSTCGVRPAFRITPAYAGKRLLRSFCDTREWDHPRVCGEKDFLCLIQLFGKGSPPRMRGKVSGAGGHRPAEGITPAYAGKSRAFFSSLATLADHPRVCGEKREEKQAGAGWEGSPPRMRGKGIT